MKRIVLFVLMLVSVAAISQPANYLNIRSRYNLIAVKNDSGFHVPGYSTIPNYRGGVWSGAGNIGVDTVNNKFYFYSGGAWREAGSTNYADSLRRSGLAVQMQKNGNWTTQFNLPDSLKQLIVGNIGGYGESVYGATINDDTLFMQLFSPESPGLTPAGGDAAKADTSDLLRIDTSGVQDGFIPYWDAANDKVVFAAPTGGGSTDSTWHISFKTGVTTYAPAVGDSVFKHTYLNEKVMDVYREGKRQVYDDSVGYEYSVADTTITFHPVLATNERIDIILRDSARQRWLALDMPHTTTTINYEGSADGGDNGGGSTSHTFSYTVSGSNNRVLLVGFVGDVVAGADDVSSVTYNGVSLTLAAKSYSSGNRKSYLYYLLNPATGAHNVTITCASSHYILAGAAEYSGVQGVDSTKEVHTASNATTLTSTITTTANNCWTVIFEHGYNGQPAVAGAGVTRRTYDAGLNIWTWFDSNAAITPPQNYSMTTTHSSDLGFGISHCIIALKPYN